MDTTIKDLPSEQAFHISGIPVEAAIGPSISEHFLIIWIGHATGSLSVDFKSNIIEENSWTFITTGQLFELKAFQMMGTILTFDPLFINNRDHNQVYLRKHPLLHQTQLFPSFTPEGLDKTNMDIIVKLMSQEYKRQDRSYGVLRSYLTVLLETSSRSLLKSMDEQINDGETDDERVVHLWTLIDRYYHSYHDTRFYSDHLEITPKRANEIFKEKTGYTIIDAVHRRINLEMKKKVGFTDIPFKEIGLELGFKDPSYFSRVFKRQNGVSPQEYREEFLIVQ